MNTLSCNNDQTLFEPKNETYSLDYASYNQGVHAQFIPSVTKEVAATQVAKGPGAVFRGYEVRRLTPTECARLQGFPDWWCSDLGTDRPSAEDIAFWTDVFETHRRLTGCSQKPKTERQIIKCSTPLTRIPPNIGCGGTEWRFRASALSSPASVGPLKMSSNRSFLTVFILTFWWYFASLFLDLRRL